MRIDEGARDDLNKRLTVELYVNRSNILEQVSGSLFVELERHLFVCGCGREGQLVADVCSYCAVIEERSDDDESLGGSRFNLTLRVRRVGIRNNFEIVWMCYDVLSSSLGCPTNNRCTRIDLTASRDSFTKNSHSATLFTLVILFR